MKPWLYVGAKVVCVDASRRSGLIPIPSDERPREGAVYTVREVFVSPYAHHGVMIRLEELRRSDRYSETGHEAGYFSGRFRPLLPDTKRAVNEMRNLMLDATRKVDA